MQVDGAGRSGSAAAQAGPSQAYPTIPLTVFPTTFPTDFRTIFRHRFPDYVPYRFPDPFPDPALSYAKIVSSHPVPSTKSLPTLPSHPHPAGNKRKSFPIPSLGRPQKISACGGQHGPSAEPRQCACPCKKTEKSFKTFYFFCSIQIPFTAKPDCVSTLIV